jgi:hypothetical protein
MDIHYAYERDRNQPMNKLIAAPLFAVMLAGSLPSLAEEGVAASHVSFEDNMKAMDKDRDGMVSVQEVRAALEARHGKGYEQSILADMEASASGRSCSTPFAQNFY